REEEGGRKGKEKKGKREEGRKRKKKIARVLISSSALASIATVSGADDLPSVRWKQHTINDQSPYEACGAADFNGDGKIDIFCGDSWYEAPAWTRHKVREVPASGPNPHYHEDFADSPVDVNGDGRPDIVTCNYFGKRVGWVQNPGGAATTAWQEHEIDLPGNMETGEMVNLTGDA
ncbi:MAG: FG-GAP repeat domain-containing protein, partial [Planctomycetaceae bacterium]